MQIFFTKILEGIAEDKCKLITNVHNTARLSATDNRNNTKGRIGEFYVET